MASSVGIDLGSRTITVAEVKRARGQAQVVNFGGVELPPEVIREGEVVDVDAVAAALKEVLQAAKLRAKRVWLGVANQRVVVRQVDLPWMEEAELRAALRYQVQEHIPLPVEEAELDVHVVEEFVSETGERLQRVLLVAAHSAMIARHVEVATRAGLKPVGIDLNPFATLRVLAENTSFGEGKQVFVDIGASVTNVVVHEGGVPNFVRILLMGGDGITEALAEGLGLGSPEAEAYKQELSIGFGEDRAQRILNEQAQVFVDEVRSSLDYYLAQTGGGQLASVVLTGGGALLRGLAEQMEAVLHLPVEVGNPFERLPATSTAYSPEELARVGPPLATAIGLALGGLE